MLYPGVDDHDDGLLRVDKWEDSARPDRRPWAPVRFSIPVASESQPDKFAWTSPPLWRRRGLLGSSRNRQERLRTSPPPAPRLTRSARPHRR